MGLLDIFRKKDRDDGTYRRDRSRDGELYGGFDGYGGNGAATEKDFRITVEDVFGITGRGTVVTGRVESGSVNVGDIVRLRRMDGSGRDVAVTGIEMFRKMMDMAKQGDNVGLLLDVGKNGVGRGDVLESITGFED